MGFDENFVCVFTPAFFFLLSADLIPLASNWYLPKSAGGLKMFLN